MEDYSPYQQAIIERLDQGLAAVVAAAFVICFVGGWALVRLMRSS